MMRTRAAAVAALVSALPARASASSATEYPDNGVAQFSRGGAWLATASDPLAAFYNPAALALQATAASVGAHVAFQRICLARKGPGGAAASYSPIGEPYPEVCNENAGRPSFLPHLAVALRASERLGVGLSVTPPASYGRLEWPAGTEVTDASGQRRAIPAAQRYLSLGSDETSFFITLAAGLAIRKNLRAGVGFVAGVSQLELDFASIGQADPAQLRSGDDASTDRRHHVEARDLFVPGAVASVDYSPTPTLDVAAWYRYSDAIRARGNLDVWSPLYGAAPASNELPECSPGSSGACAARIRASDRLGKDPVSLKRAIPMQLRIGARWHVPHPPATGLLAERLGPRTRTTRDPLADDHYDLELDLTYSNDSAAKTTEIRLPQALALGGTAAAVPANSDQSHGYHDSFGARLGGQYAVIRNVFGIRLGTWIQTPKSAAEDLDVSAVPAWRGGLATGVVFRVQAVDLEFGYQHAYNFGLDNGGDGGRRAVAGSSTEPANFDGRSYHAVNGGKVSQSANVFALGAIVRF
jgi:hypothetical protein